MKSFVAVSQGILGVTPDYDGLTVSPCLPDSISDLRITRLFRGTVYEIDIYRGGSKGMVVNGSAVSGHTVPLTDAPVCKVSVNI